MIRHKSVVNLYRNVMSNVKLNTQKGKPQIFSAFLILLTNLKSIYRNGVKASEAFRTANMF